MIAANKLRDILNKARGQKDHVDIDDLPEKAHDHHAHSTRAHRITRFPILAEYEVIFREGRTMRAAHRIVAAAHGISVEQAMTRFERAAANFRESEKRRNKVAN